MALKKENAIRIDKYRPPSYYKGKTGPKNVYIFKCLKCTNEIKVQQNRLNKATGLCLTCSNRVSQHLAVQKKRLNPFESLYRRLKDAALIRQNINIDLTYEQFVEFTNIKNCHYCDSLVTWNKPSTYNLDRKNNKIGYTLINLVVCCGQCNKIKGNYFTFEEFILLSPLLKQIRKERLNGS